MKFRNKFSPMIQEVYIDSNIKLQIFVLPISSRKEKLQCLFKKGYNGVLDTVLHTSINDIVTVSKKIYDESELSLAVGSVFRTCILTYLGVADTVKASSLSVTFNKVVDYNKYNDKPLPFLD
jgi:hypothetical protein